MSESGNGKIVYEDQICYKQHYTMASRFTIYSINQISVLIYQISYIIRYLIYQISNINKISYMSIKISCILYKISDILYKIS